MTTQDKLIELARKYGAHREGLAIADWLDGIGMHDAARAVRIRYQSDNDSPDIVNRLILAIAKGM